MIFKVMKLDERIKGMNVDKRVQIQERKKRREGRKEGREENRFND